MPKSAVYNKKDKTGYEKKYSLQAIFVNESPILWSAMRTSSLPKQNNDILENVSWR